MNGRPEVHGLAQSVLELTEHMGQVEIASALRILVNRSVTHLFPAGQPADRGELLDTDIRPGAVHRSWELGQLIRDVGAAVFYAPYPLFAPLSARARWWLLSTTASSRAAPGMLAACTASSGSRWLLLRSCAGPRRFPLPPTLASLAEIRRHYPAAPNPTLIPNGIDIGQFTSVTDGAVARAAARERYHLPERFILTVGAHRPHKNHGVLLRALAVMPPTVSLVYRRLFRPEIPGLASTADFPARPGLAG